MAEQPTAPPPPPSNAAIGPRPDETAKPAVPAASLVPGKTEEATKAAAAAEKDPLREVLDRMDRMQPVVASFDRGLARTMQSLVEQGSDPERRSQPGFRHEVAYALQDLEKSRVGRIDISPEARSEMTRLAGSAPGLENERALGLLRSTASLEDKSLIREIRQVGGDLGRHADQNSAEVQNRIDVIENKVRLAQRPSEPVAATQTAASSDARIEAARSTPPQQPAADDGNQAASTRRNDHPQQNRSQNGEPVTVRHSVLDTILRGMRPDTPSTPPPWEPPHTPMAERIAALEKTTRASLDERAFDKAEKSGRAALDALQGFSAGEGPTVMNRIREAATSASGGMAGVLSEMREGGRFADLRHQFNNALETEHGVAAAYDKAASALGRYGENRVAAQTIAGHRPDAAAITARFEQMDADIGKAAASTPSRKDGASMLDDLAKSTAELLSRAVEAIRSAFSRTPSADATARPAPSMSMGA